MIFLVKPCIPPLCFGYVRYYSMYIQPPVSCSLHYSEAISFRGNEYWKVSLRLIGNDHFHPFFDNIHWLVMKIDNEAKVFPGYRNTNFILQSKPLCLVSFILYVYKHYVLSRLWLWLLTSVKFLFKYLVNTTYIVHILV